MSVTDDIKARVDILDLIGSYNVTLKRAGRIYKACCPFHQERTPSFAVYPDSGTWRCFGACAEGGDVFNFVMKQENLDFKGALEVLAGRAGIELRPQSNEQKERDHYLDKLRGLLTESVDFFYQHLISSPDAQFARTYIRRRGLNQGTVDQFRMGYAPDDWRQALTHLGALGYDEQAIIDAGIAIRNDKGNVYDRFRNRLMIPIRDARGQVTGFGARALAEGDNPKYLNSPQTALFDKSHTLFALDAARRLIRETETAVIVEGYMDAIQAHQGGFTNVVAQMGTALTEVQLRTLSKYAKKLVIALDPDEAGANATLRGLNVARQTLGDMKAVFDPSGVLRQSTQLDMDIRVMTLPEGQDPDDLIRDEPDKWQGLVEGAQPIIDYVIDSGTARVTPTMVQADREAIARDILPILLESEPHRHYSVQKLALKLRINERDLMMLAQQQQALNRPLPASVKQQEKLARRVTAPFQPASDNQQPNTPLQTVAQAAATIAPTAARTGIDLEGYCLAALIQNPDWWPLINRRLAHVAPMSAARDALLSSFSPEDFEATDYRAILTAFKLAIEQFDLEPLDFLYKNVPTELHAEIDRLLAGDMAAFQQKQGFHNIELEGIGKEKRFEKPIIYEDVFIAKAIEVRLNRIKRESQDLQYLIHDSNDVSAPAYQEFRRRRLVRSQLEGAIRQMKQLQH